MLELQKLLLQDGLDGLLPLGIKARSHPKYPNLVCFKYDQRGSPMSIPAVQQARGIILDGGREWAVVSMSFVKFFNLGEPLAVELDWETARIEEKYDGSLLCLYGYEGAWQVQTSGTADAGGKVVADVRSSGNQTFAELFWSVFERLGYKLPSSELLGRHTFAFELMTPQNRVVVPHLAARLVLIGVRDLHTLEEQDPALWATKLGFEGARTFTLTREGMLQAAANLPAREGEGFVVRDAQFRRVKVKGDAYVRAALIKESFTPRRALAVVLAGEQSEFSVHFPEYSPLLAQLESAIERFEEAVQTEYQRLAPLESVKEFALAAQKSSFSVVLFALRKGQATSPRDVLNRATETQRERLLEPFGLPDFLGAETESSA